MKAVYTVVGFILEDTHSIGYKTFERPEKAGEFVVELLTREVPADVISIRRVYQKGET